MLGSLNAILAADELPPVVQANFASSALDYTSLTTLTSMPSGGSISRAGQAMVYDATGKLTYAQNNNLFQSQTFNTASWVLNQINAFGSGSVANTNATLDPIGTNTASFLQENTATALHQIYQTITYN